jgi:hypothetical protein
MAAVTTACVAAAGAIITAGRVAVIAATARPHPIPINLESIMKNLIVAIAAATALLTTAAVAAPLSPAVMGAADGVSTEQVRLVCDEYGRCFRTRGPRYVQPGYGYGGYDRGYDRGPRYERRGYYGGGGPSISFGFGGGRGW